MKKLFLLASAVITAPTLATAQYAEALGVPKSMQNKGSIEGGLSIANGNSDATNINVGANLTSTYNKLENVLKGRAINLEQNNQRTAEEYLVNDKLKYNVTDQLYGFGEGEYYNNRYAGFDQRTHELAGVGYYFRKDDQVKVSAETGVGARQTKYSGGTPKNSNEVIAKVGGNVNWKVNENVEFNQDADYYWGDDNQVTRSETSLKSYMNKDLYLKAAYLIENNSTVPVGRKDNDQLTTFSVGYQLGE